MLVVVVSAILLTPARASCAVAVLLTTRPSQKGDGWRPRSVQKISAACPLGPTLCGVLVLARTIRDYGDVDCDVVALVDDDAVSPALRENGIRPVVMELEKVFDEYLLMRKFLVLKLVEYQRVLLLDSDTIVTGSLAHLFRGEPTCGRPLNDECWPEEDYDQICDPGRPAEVIAQQTPGTPVLTAFFLVRPNLTTYQALASELTKRCGGPTICDRQDIYENGWAGPVVPHSWSLRSRARREVQRSWSNMGAGFTDQGFAEYFFGLHLKSLYSISHRTCRMKYIHFNYPPKPWFCPGDHCRRDLRPGGKKARQGRKPQRRRRRRVVSGGDERRHLLVDDIVWGGHKCAIDWWWQYTRTRIRVPPGDVCVSRCLADLDRMAATHVVPSNHTGRCKDWNPQWPFLQPETRPPK